jgi:hypothetical protein
MKIKFRNTSFTYFHEYGTITRSLIISAIGSKISKNIWQYNYNHIYRDFTIRGIRDLMQDYLQEKYK